jgi:hypothetical protein
VSEKIAAPRQRKPYLGQLTAMQAKLQAVNRRLGNQLEEVKSMQRKLKIAVDLNALFANADGIKKAASKAKAEAEAEAEASGSSKKSYNIRTIRGEGIKKGFRYVGESKDRVLYVLIVVVDKKLEYCVVMCNSKRSITRYGY